LGNIKFQVG
jgi:hypothetical protein